MWLYHNGPPQQPRLFTTPLNWIKLEQNFAVLPALSWLISLMKTRGRWKLIIFYPPRKGRQLWALSLSLFRSHLVSRCPRECRTPSQSKISSSFSSRTSYLWRVPSNHHYRRLLLLTTTTYYYYHHYYYLLLLPTTTTYYYLLPTTTLRGQGNPGRDYLS